MKRKYLSFLIISVLLLTSLIISVLLLTFCIQDTTQVAKDEFSKYYNGKDDVVLRSDPNLYFENHFLDLDGLVKDNEYNSGLIVKQDLIYFSTCKQNSMFDFTLNIYESNLQGTNIKKLYSKEGFKTYPWAYAIDDEFYIEHYSKIALFKADARIIDKYTISTGIYENIANGKDYSLSDYMQKEEQSRYSIEVVESKSNQEHGKFIVTDLEKGLSNTIDDAYLKNTEYIESMDKFNYGPWRVDISNGKILLTYGIGAGDGWNYSHLVFEYDFDTNNLEYKLLAFPYDSVCAKIIYIG